MICRRWTGTKQASGSYRLNTFFRTDEVVSCFRNKVLRKNACLMFTLIRFFRFFFLTDQSVNKVLLT